MCCGQWKKPKKAGAGVSGSSFSATSAGKSEAVRVEYVGEPGFVSGTVTGASYGARSPGETFLVWRRDFEAMEDVFLREGR